MEFRIRLAFVPAIAIIAGCSSASGVRPAAGEQVSIEGKVLSVDTQPWTYDGNAVVMIDAGRDGQVAVQLPARWNLCKAPAVAVDALGVGTRVRAIGTLGAEGEVIVCADASHRLEPAGAP